MVMCLRPNSMPRGGAAIILLGDDHAFLTAGTGIPAILRFTEPRKFQLVKLECLPVWAAEGEVCGLGLAVDDAPEFLALGVEYPKAPRPTAIDVPGNVHLHAVRHAGLSRASVPFGAMSKARMCLRRLSLM